MVMTTPLPRVRLRRRAVADARVGGARHAARSSHRHRRDAARDAVVASASGTDVALARIERDYDARALEEAFASQGVELAARSAEVAWAFSSFLFDVLVLDRVFDVGDAARSARNLERAAQLRDTFTRLGPAFVKVGQALSVRPDLVPPEYMRVLETLQDKIPSFPSSVALPLIESELGRRIDDVFETITDEPVAAASLGQVYKARLRRGGEVVAVKVQRPGITSGIAKDMLLLRRAMAAVDASGLVPLAQPLVPLVDEFASKLFGELDYVLEADNAEEFARNYGGVPRVRVPKMHRGYSTAKVLTMEWIDGVKLSDDVELRRRGLDPLAYIDVGIECTLRQLLDKGFFHADPHPGNLLAMRTGELAYIDFGMMSMAPPTARFGIIEHVVHLVNRDYPAMCRDYYTLDFCDESEVDTSPIATDLAEFFDDVLEQSVSQLNFKSIVDGLGGVLFRYPFRVPAYYALILRALTVLEGLALKTDPAYRLISRAYPYMARRLLTDESPELRSSLEELLLEDEKRTFRWERLENLVVEGTKDAGFDGAQVWDFLEWLMSEDGGTTREPLKKEIIRLIDAAAAISARNALENALAFDAGNAALAARLVPLRPEDEEAMNRIRLLSSVTRGDQRPPNRLPAPSSTSTSTSLTVGNQMSLERVSARVEDVRNTIESVLPRLQHLLAMPGSQSFASEVASGVFERALARGVQAALGPGSSPSSPSSQSSS